MKKRSCLVVTAAAVMLVSLQVVPVLAESNPNTSTAPNAATTPTPGAVPAASPAVTTTTPAATTTELPKVSKKNKVARMTRRNSRPKAYLSFVPFEKLF
jgi:hypothetical protein